MLTNWWLLTGTLVLFLLAAIWLIFFALKTGIGTEDAERIDPLPENETAGNESDGQK
ncbi:hypothetical protein [Metabacillus sp. 84]|uniref:hypothetical protein n=1 Tax=unclassified Metabacillus TaxID=2675274 RepID=UPI003CF1E3BC